MLYKILFWFIVADVLTLALTWIRRPVDEACKGAESNLIFDTYMLLGAHVWFLLGLRIREARWFKRRVVGTECETCLEVGALCLILEGGITWNIYYPPFSPNCHIFPFTLAEDIYVAITIWTVCGIFFLLTCPSRASVPSSHEAETSRDPTPEDSPTRLGAFSGQWPEAELTRPQSQEAPTEQTHLLATPTLPDAQV